jgi:hypothetical protein
MQGNLHVRFGERDGETYGRNAVWRSIPTLPTSRAGTPKRKSTLRTNGLSRACIRVKRLAAEDCVVENLANGRRGFTLSISG